MDLALFGKKVDVILCFWKYLKLSLYFEPINDTIIQWIQEPITSLRQSNYLPTSFFFFQLSLVKHVHMSKYGCTAHCKSWSRFLVCTYYQHNVKSLIDLFSCLVIMMMTTFFLCVYNQPVDPVRVQSIHSFNYTHARSTSIDDSPNSRRGCCLLSFNSFIHLYATYYPVSLPPLFTRRRRTMMM